jgi:thiosulfate dehydrogenase (quinone) large subunit
MRTQSALGKISEGAHERMFGVTYLALRFVVGAMFFLSGWKKITSDWSASSYLLAANGPFADWFHSLAGSGFIDTMNAWGMLFLGIALLLGLCVRPAAILGAVLMMLYYLAHFVANTASGLIDEHIILIVVLAMFAAGGAGHAFGLNAVVMGNLRKPNAVTRFIFG